MPEGCYRLLVVDDERNIRRALEKFFKQKGFYVETARSYEEAVSRLQQNNFDLVLTDMRLPGRSGLELLKWIKHHSADVPVVVITAYGSIENAVEAMKAGASNYITKPVDLTEIFAIVRHTLIHSGHIGVAETAEKPNYGIIGQSRAIKEIMAIIEAVSTSRSTILITGESGTGKELVARAIHSASARKGPFVPINCAAIPSELIENELFGHEAGAYTGATTTKRGKVEIANGGTLFLDEIAEMPIQMQVKLLRFIQDREFYRVGGTLPLSSDCRIIAATNKDIEEEVTGGRFREDLYWRLNVIHIHVPPLRERMEDIPKLAMSFLRRFAEENHKLVTGIEETAMEALMRYKWPGNVRELENVIERAVVLTKGQTITLSDLPHRISKVDNTYYTDLALLSSMKLSEIEKAAVIRALQEENWNQTRAAKRLGITRRQLRTKMLKYGLL